MTDRTASPPELDLDAAASAYDIPAGDVDAVVQRARRFAARRRAGTAVVVAVALVAGGVATQSLLTSPSTTAIPVTTDGGAVRGETGITWRKAIPKAGLAGLGLTTGSAGSGPLYALSTAAGERFTDRTRRNSVLWRSEDGVDWTAAATVDGDLRISSLVSTPDRLYAVGTAAPASAPRGSFDVVAGWSDDQGRSFARTTLPIDLRRHLDDVSSLHVNGASIASGDQGTLVVVTIAASLDVPSLVPDDAPPVRRWATTPTGVDILGTERNGCTDDELDHLDERKEPVDLTGFRCADRGASRRTPQQIFGVLESYTFEELGVDDELRRIVRRQPFVFHAAPGSTTFEHVPVGDTTPLFGPAMIEAHDGGFEIVSTAGEADEPTPRIVALRSPDGRTFERSDDLPELSWVSGIGRVRGVTTIVGGNDRGGVIIRARGDGTWATTSLASVIDPDVLGDRVPQPFVAGVGDFGVVISAVLSERDGDGGGLPRSRLVVSRDGVRFEDLALETLAGTDEIRGVHRILVTSDRAVVTLATGEAKPEGVPSEQVALIGVAS